METASKNTKRRTQQDIDALLGRYHKSEMSTRAFCEAEGVADSSLYKWLRRESPKKASPELVEVKAPVSSVSGGLKIATPRGYQVEVPAGFAADELKRLLDVLES